MTMQPASTAPLIVLVIAGIAALILAVFYRLSLTRTEADDCAHTCAMAGKTFSAFHPDGLDWASRCVCREMP